MSTLRKLHSLLSRRERLQAYGMLAVIVATSVLQVAGIASIAPFLALVADPTVITRHAYLSWAYHAFDFDSERSFVMWAGFVILAVFAVSNLAGMLTTWALLRFSWGRNHALSVRLLSHYLTMPYAFFLNRNSAELSRNVLSEVAEVINGLIIPGMHALARILVAVGIVAVLVAVDPVLAVMTATVLGGAYLIVYLFVRRKLASIGRERFAASETRYQTTGEGLAGIKEIKVLGRESVFLRRYSEAELRYARARVAAETISKLPHYLIEILAFGGLLLIAMYLVLSRGLTDVVPVIGLYAFASYRLLPAIKEIFSGIARVRQNVAPLDRLYEDLRRPAMLMGGDRDATLATPLHGSLVLHEITFRYPGAAEPVLERFSVTIKANTSVAFVGPTGSGKTTTVDIILGLLRPESGQLLVDGVAVTDGSLASWQKNLGYVPQHIYLADDTVAHNIAFGVPYDKVDCQAVERAARIARIHDFIVRELADGYHTRVGERGVRLSGGQRQRIGVARAVYHDPDVLVLDEATSALDGVTEEEVLRAVENVAGSKTVIMIAHRLSTVRRCDTIFVLAKGRIVAQGTYDELMATCPAFQAMATGSAAGADDARRS